MGEPSDRDERGDGVLGATDARPGASSAAPAPSRRARGPLAVVVALAVLFAAAVLGTSWVTSSPRVCASCHEMQPLVAAWQRSPHAEVTCYDCHQTPRPWYGWPQTLGERVAWLVRDFRKHRARGLDDPPLRMNEAGRAALSDEVCGRCHNASRRATPRFGILINHAEHAKKNKSCTSCHFWTAHPDAARSDASLMMDRCFNCHGLSAGAKAPGTCTLCHQKGLDLRPDSHKVKFWRPDHAKIADSEPQPCTMCHGPNPCRDCHGLELPHPAGWETKTGHPVAGTRDPQLCAKCHGAPPNLCSMCHHRGFDPAKSPWIQQHPVMVRESGADVCVRCHEGAFCVACHSKAQGRPGALTQP